MFFWCILNLETSNLDPWRPFKQKSTKPVLASDSWKRGLDKRGLGKQSFLQKSLEKQKNNQTYIKNHTKCMPKATGAAFSGTPRGRRRFLLLAHILYDFSYMFGCFPVFPMIFAEKWYFRPLLSGPVSGAAEGGTFFNKILFLMSFTWYFVAFS